MTQIKRHITLQLTLAAALVLTACGDIDAIKLVEDPAAPAVSAAPAAEQSCVRSDVSLSLRLDGVSQPSRAGEADTTRLASIGRGGMIDFIIYAVYDSEGSLLANFADANSSEVTIDGVTIKAAHGQNILRWEGEYITVALNSLPQGDYKFVCWAQSSKCGAYDTGDLHQVRVSYEGALNNDESRDAFCASKPFTIIPDNPQQYAVEVTLRRPLAQINVGTSGADYANYADNIYGGVPYAYSAVTLRGVSDTIDVVDDVIGAPVEGEITFALNKIAAYNGMDIPTADADRIYTQGEELLLIHLNDEVVNDGDGDGFADFTTAYPTVEYDGDGSRVGRYLTESFKYLSMCYVLVPSAGEAASTLDNIKVAFADSASGTGRTTSLYHSPLPVKRNRRTNIIGGLYAPEGPEVDDPSSVFSSVLCRVTVVTSYFNDINLPQGEWQE